MFNIPRVMRGLEPRIDRFCVTNDVNAATLAQLGNDAGIYGCVRMLL